MNLENFAFRWFVLYNYITTHGAKKHKNTKRHLFLFTNLMHNFFIL
jgi:hypothetical protein